MTYGQAEQGLRNVPLPQLCRDTPRGYGSSRLPESVLQRTLPVIRIGLPVQEPEQRRPDGRLGGLEQTWFQVEGDYQEGHRGAARRGNDYPNKSRSVYESWRHVLAVCALMASCKRVPRQEPRGASIAEFQKLRSGEQQIAEPRKWSRFVPEIRTRATKGRQRKVLIVLETGATVEFCLDHFLGSLLLTMGKDPKRPCLSLKEHRGRNESI